MLRLEKEIKIEFTAVPINLTEKQFASISNMSELSTNLIPILTRTFKDNKIIEENNLTKRAVLGNTAEKLEGGGGEEIVWLV